LQWKNQPIHKQLKRHQHFVESADVYSLSDLVELSEGRLEAEMRAILCTFTQHIKRDCQVCAPECASGSPMQTCAGNGFICELCVDKSVIFPFDENVRACKLCCAVYHRYFTGD
jgi:hypothetical protein